MEVMAVVDTAVVDTAEEATVAEATVAEGTEVEAMVEVGTEAVVMAAEDTVEVEAAMVAEDTVEAEADMAVVAMEEVPYFVFRLNIDK